MPKMNGCNEGMCAPAGSRSTRMNPTDFARNNMAKGGVNGHAGGTDKAAKKPAVGKGKAHDGKPRR